MTDAIRPSGYGEFECQDCGERFAELVPPIWLGYWPEHCGEPVQLIELLEREALTH